MNLIKKTKVLAFIGSFVFFHPAFAQEEEDVGGTRGLGCAFVGPIQGVYFNQHITYGVSKKNEQAKRQEIEERTIEQYIKRLDGSKLYFLEADVREIRSKLKGILASVEKRPNADCSRLTEVQTLFEKRVAERVDFAKKYLGKDFKFQKETKLVLNPDQRQYPSNQKEADDFQKDYIQFQISNFIATDMKLDEAKEMVLRRYDRNLRRVQETTEDRILASYLDAFARALDPHSSYFSHDVMEDFKISMALSLEGIGATLSFQDGYTVVEQLIPGGAAAREGSLRPKDKIVAVGQGDCEQKNEAKTSCPMENVIEVELRDVVKKIRGPKGSKVRLSILREGGGETKRHQLTLVRDKVKLEDEAASISYVDREVDGRKIKVGVIDLPSFYSDSRPGGRTAANDLKKILKEAKKSKVDGIVLDFSSNGGGSLDDAVKIAGLFFKTGAVVKQSAKRGQETLLSDEDDDVDYAGPLVILTSRISASASEIVAGTLQDYKRAVIVGADHTFGKGSVQSVIPLPSKLGAAKVTVGMFYTPGGNSTQHRGVDADVVLPSSLSTDEIGEKTLDYSLPPTSLAPFLSKSAYVTSGDEAWQAVSPDEIKKLKDLSRIRVAKNEEFKKIVEEAKKTKEKDYIIDLSETLQERTESKKKEDEEPKDELGNRSKEAKLAEYFKRPDVQEAINVTVDLTALRKGLEMTLADQAKEKKNQLAH